MKRTLLLLTIFLVSSAHELFLKTDSHFLERHASAELYLFNGTFDASENIITRDRIIAAQVIGPGFKFLPTQQDYYDKDKATYLRFKTGDAGTYVAGVSTLPRVIELSAKDFKDYLQHEGLTDVIAEREQKGLSGQPAKERYSKHVKALLQVTEKRTSHFNTRLGYPIEFVPKENPYDLSVGDPFTLTLLLDGKAVADQVVHYSYRPASGTPGERSGKTNSKGEITLLLDHPGQWYAATIHMTESNEENIDYVSNWATLTFEVR